MKTYTTTDEEELLNTLDVLKQLERNHIDRNELLRQEERRLNLRKEILALIIGLIGAVLMVIFELSALTENLSAGNIVGFLSHLVYVVAVFVILYIGFSILWKSPVMKGIRDRFRYPIHESLKGEIVKINARSQQILTEPEISESSIPRCYLSIQALNLLDRYFRFGQATTIHDAITMLEHDMVRTDGVKPLKNQDNVIYMEKDAIAKFEREGLTA